MGRWRHPVMFWAAHIFGSLGTPEAYIKIFAILGIVSAIIPAFSGKRLSWLSLNGVRDL
ncbi:hypothetical protein OK016_20280 [Vibrio chagasii]|nr:hypothetical protein [Vibrio chagasii]